MSSSQISQTAVFSVGNDLIILVVFHLGGPISFISLMRFTNEALLNGMLQISFLPLEGSIVRSCTFKFFTIFFFSKSTGIKSAGKYTSYFTNIYKKHLCEWRQKLDSFLLKT